MTNAERLGLICLTVLAACAPPATRKTHRPDAGAGDGAGANNTNSFADANGAGGSKTPGGGAGSSGGSNVLGGSNMMGGSGGSGGSKGSGGSAGGAGMAAGGAAGMGVYVACSIGSAVNNVVTATSNVISDFAYMGGMGAVKDHSFTFGDFATQVSGFSYHYSDGTVAETLTASNWHVAGKTGVYGAFAIGFSCITDASQFKGIEFTIKGNAGMTGRVTLWAEFATDFQGSKDPAKPSRGLCDGNCKAPTFTVDVTAAETLVQVPWSAFRGGKPMDTVNPAQITGIQWVFASAQAAYDVDVTVGKLHFMTANAADAGAPRDAGARDVRAGN